MSCELCKKKQATVHIQEITDGNKRELHLCDTCANKQGIKTKFHLTVEELLGVPRPRTPKVPRVKCPACGITLETIRTRARLGCAQDLEVFQEWLAPFIEKIHGAGEHVGKVPRGAGQTHQREVELRLLKQQLEDAVRREDFEGAARLRDQIRRLSREGESE